MIQSGKHIGKIVIEIPRNVQELDKQQHQPATPAAVFQFRSDRTYLLVGGLGGLGRALATWMVENGACSLIFLSRSARKGPGVDAFVQDLHSQGCQVPLIDSSVSNKADVQRAVENQATAARALGGGITLSMILRDVGLSDMTFADWNTAVEPKVHGANTFLDAFVHFRHRQGLVASVIDLGVMGDVGFVSQNQDVLDSFSRSGMRILREQDLLGAMVLTLKKSRPTQPVSSPEFTIGQVCAQPSDTTYRSPSQILLGLNTAIPISSPLNRVSWRRDARMSIYHNLEGSSSTGPDGQGNGNVTSSQRDSLRAKLASTTDDEEKTAAITRALAAALASFLIKDEDSIPLDQPLERLGMDSLLAMEVRNWIRQRVGVEMSIISIVQSPSLNHWRSISDWRGKELNVRGVESGMIERGSWDGRSQSAAVGVTIVRFRKKRYKQEASQ